jgi:hypothetical protein
MAKATYSNYASESDSLVIFGCSRDDRQHRLVVVE